MSAPVTLHGQFVDLRPLEPSDAAITLAWRQGQRARLLNRGAGTLTDQQRWIESRGADEHNFIIQRKDCYPLGMLALIGVDRTHGDEEAARGLPASVEAMSLLYEFAFDTLQLRRVFGTVASANARMIKWQKYLGMTQEGVMRQHLFLDGKVQDSIVLGLLADEYRASVRAKMNAMIKLSAAPTS